MLDGHVVPAETPGPRALQVGFAENFEPIQLRIAPTFATEVDMPVLHMVEDILEGHDRGCGDVAGFGQARGEKLHRAALLGWAHVGERQASMIGRGVVPPVALIVGGSRRKPLEALVVGEAVEPRPGRAGHALRRSVVGHHALSIESGRPSSRLHGGTFRRPYDMHLLHDIAVKLGP